NAARWNHQSGHLTAPVADSGWQRACCCDRNHDIQSGHRQLDPFGKSPPDSERHFDQPGGGYAHDGDFRAGTFEKRQDYAGNCAALFEGSGITWPVLNMKGATARKSVPASPLPTIAGMRWPNCVKKAYASSISVK